MPSSDVADHMALLGIAEQLARGAGELTVRLRGTGRTLDVDRKSSPTDVVTEVDHASERWLLDRLAELRPHDAVLGEEGADRSGDSGVRWVVDPIDGTVNFLYGLRPYAVSVAAERDGVVVAGCVHDPTSGETFTAALGGGARLDGVPLDRPWLAPRLDTALVATGFGYDAALRAAQGRVLAGVLSRVGNVRRLGSAALDCCYVAARRIDGYWEYGLKHWDSAAGLLVAAESGALVGGLYGRPPGPLTVVASPAVGPDLVRLLEELRADELGVADGAPVADPAAG